MRGSAPRNTSTSRVGLMVLVRTGLGGARLHSGTNFTRKDLRSDDDVSASRSARWPRRGRKGRRRSSRVIGRRVSRSVSAGVDDPELRTVSGPSSCGASPDSDRVPPHRPAFTRPRASSLANIRYRPAIGVPRPQLPESLVVLTFDSGSTVPLYTRSTRKVTSIGLLPGSTSPVGAITVPANTTSAFSSWSAMLDSMHEHAAAGAADTTTRIAPSVATRVRIPPARVTRSARMVRRVRRASRCVVPRCFRVVSPGLADVSPTNDQPWWFPHGR